MSRPAWMPSGNEIARQLVLAAIVAGAAWALHRYVAARRCAAR